MKNPIVEELREAAATMVDAAAEMANKFSTLSDSVAEQGDKMVARALKAWKTGASLNDSDRMRRALDAAIEELEP